jgi:hypothetical protein
MPEINKVYTLKITPEQFLDACSATELWELDQLIQSPRYQNKIMQMQPGYEFQVMKKDETIVEVLKLAKAVDKLFGN